MGPTWGPPGSFRPQMGPILADWTLLSGKNIITCYAISQPQDDTGTWSRRAKTRFMMTSSNGNIFCVTGPFVRGIHRSQLDSPHRGQWRGALIFFFMCNWTNGCEQATELTGFETPWCTCDVTAMVFLHFQHHWSDVIMSATASKITSLTIAYSTVYSGADHKKNIKALRHWPF